jgi:tellurite resistance protein TehA-like permease
MATGVVSLALRAASVETLSLVFLGLAAAGYVELMVSEGLKLRRARDALLGLEGVRGRLGLFAFAAGSAVLASRFALLGWGSLGLVLLVIGGVSALLFSYLVPITLAQKREGLQMLDQGGGAWLLWAVSLEAVGIAASELSHSAHFAPATMAALAAGLWGLGLFIYLPLLVLLGGNLIFSRSPLPLVGPSYWVCMGAAAVSVVAGCQIVADPATTRLLPYLRGPVLAADTWLWALATALIPLLVALLITRWRRRHQFSAVPHEMWVAVFPIGMYSLASSQLGVAVHLPWLVNTGHIAVWFALAAWLVDLGRGVLMRLLPSE